MIEIPGLDKRMVHTIHINGIATTFYTIGALALALGKKPVSVRRWIRAGIIPDTQYVEEPVRGATGGGGVRLWSPEQLEVIVEAARESGVLGKRPMSMEQTKFKQLLMQRWGERGWPLNYVEPNLV